MWHQMNYQKKAMDQMQSETGTETIKWSYSGQVHFSPLVKFKDMNVVLCVLSRKYNQSMSSKEIYRLYSLEESPEHY